MKNTLSLHPALIVLGLGLLVAADAAPGADGDCRFSQQRSASLDTAGATSLEVIGRAGDLVLRPTSGTVVKGQGRACASSEAYLAQTQIHARREGSSIRLYVQTPDTMQGVGDLYAWLDLAVDVPANLPVRITDTSGDLTASGLFIAQITDSSGDMRLRDLKGDIDINDSSGDIRVENSAGRVRISDSSGDVLVRGARDVEIPSDSSGEIVIQKVSGSVRIDQDSSGDIRIVDVGKDVTVVADSSGDVNVTGVQGTVRVP